MSLRGGQDILHEHSPSHGANTAGDSLYFFAPALSAGSWIRSSRTYYTTIGCHRFYL